AVDQHAGSELVDWARCSSSVCPSCSLARTSRFDNCLRMLLLIEMICVLDTVSEPSTGFGDTPNAEPQAFSLKVSLCETLKLSNASILFPSSFICGWLNGPPAFERLKSQGPDVGCGPFFLLFPISRKEYGATGELSTCSNVAQIISGCPA